MSAPAAPSARGANASANDDAVLQKIASVGGVAFFEEDIVKGASKKNASSMKAALNRLKASGAVGVRDVTGEDGTALTLVWKTLAPLSLPSQPPTPAKSAATPANPYKRPIASVNTPFKAPLSAPRNEPAVTPKATVTTTASSALPRQVARVPTPGLRRVVGFRTPMRKAGATQMDAVRAELKDRLSHEEEKLRKLRMAKRYREKNDLKRLGDLTAKWKSVCQQALLALHYQLPGNPTVGELLIANQIDPKVVSYDPNDETKTRQLWSCPAQPGANPFHAYAPCIETAPRA